MITMTDAEALELQDFLSRSSAHIEDLAAASAGWQARAETAEAELDKRNATLFDIAELVSGKRDADPFFAVLDVFQRAKRFESELREVKEIVDPGHVAEALDAVDAVSTMMRIFETQRAQRDEAQAEAALRREELAVTRNLLRDAPMGFEDYTYGTWYASVNDYLETLANSGQDAAGG